MIKILQLNRHCWLGSSIPGCNKTVDISRLSIIEPHLKGRDVEKVSGNEMNGVLGHDSGLQGKPGTTWANEMNFGANHAPNAGVIAQR